MPAGEVLIRCENVSKRFCRDLKRSLWYGVKDSAQDVFGWRGKPLATRGCPPSTAVEPKLRRDEFWANRGISFELRRGECLGLIGRNGAGKTTLLKMINGLFKPDTGRIEVRGRLGALIALGAGFNPVLTGRENIYVNGSILGLSRQQILDRFDEIVAFAEIEEFLDAPVQSYSSGMRVRLGFAVAAILIQPDVLLLDEVLAVGDFAFRNKCLNRVSKMLGASAVVFVSHQESQIRRACTHGAWLDRGVLRFCGTASETLGAYEAEVLAGQEDGESFTDQGVVKAHVRVNSTEIEFDGELILCICGAARRDLGRAAVRIVFKTVSEEAVAEWHSLNHGMQIHLAEGDFNLPLRLSHLRLRNGRYRVVLEVLSLETKSPIIKWRLPETIIVNSAVDEQFSLHCAQI